MARPWHKRRRMRDWPEDELVTEASAPPQHARERWGRLQMRDPHPVSVDMKLATCHSMGECHRWAEGGPRNDLLVRWLAD
jgi:hypothetical protein